MSEDIPSLLNSNSGAEVYISAFGISALAAASRSILSEDRHSLKGFFRGLILAVFAAYLAGGVLTNYHFTDGTNRTITGVIAFAADDIFLLMLKVIQIACQNPQAVLDYIIQNLTALKGKK